MIDMIKVTEPRLAALVLTVLGALAAHAAVAQTSPSLGADSQQPAPPSEWTAQSSAELEELVGPIALYPDDLVAVVLPASTFPLQIVQAARYLEQRESEPNLEPDEAWDESVVALLNYPEALTLLNDDLDWTWALGEAVIYQQGDVLDAIQTFRDRAYAAGNLESDDRQTITSNGETITIEPAEPQVVYVPYYEPAQVVVRHSYPVYHYYPYAYPVYYYPYPAGYSFGSGFFWGVTTAFAVSWHDHFLHVHQHRQFGHPYYGRSYYQPFYARHGVYLGINRVHGYDRWQPGYRHGGRPGRHVDDRIRDRVVANARYEALAREGRLPRTAPRTGRLAAANDAAANDRRSQPRHRIRQADGVPPSGLNRAVTNERVVATEARSARAPAVDSARASTSTIRAESRFARPRGSREDLRGGVATSSRAPRVAVQDPQLRQSARQRQQSQNDPRGSALARARVTERAAQPARLTRSNVMQRVQPASPPAAQPQSAWRGAKGAGQHGAHAQGGGRSADRSDRVMSSPQQIRRAR
jgi:hypothetical protein